MKDYSAMSDFEINKKVALKLGMDWSGVTEENRFFYQTADYCNNPADAWPIIVAKKIWLRELYGNWDCKGFPSPPHPCGQVQFSDTNPLRAAMIVYLMMKDAE